MAKKARSKTKSGKTTKRPVKAARKRGAIDRCQPLREHVERLQEEIAQVREDLAEPDIPRPLRRKLEQLLRRLLAQLRDAQALLRKCEAIKDPRT